MLRNSSLRGSFGVSILTVSKPGSRSYGNSRAKAVLLFVRRNGIIEWAKVRFNHTIKLILPNFLL